MNRFRGNLTINVTQQNLISNNQSPVRQINDEPFHDHIQSDYQQKQKIITNNLNLVQFQQYTVQRPNETHKRNRTFNIDIPQIKTNQKTIKNNLISSNMFKPTKFMTNSQVSPKEFKEPPAPSKGSKKTKVFVFPTNSTEQGFQDSDYKKSQKSDKFVQKKTPLQEQWLNYRSLKDQFQRQRQQFYRQKSKFQKELLVKDAQIQMLQKIVTQKYPAEHLSLDQKDLSEMQSLILQKDIQINELLEKISILNQTLQRKNQEINKSKYDNMHFENIIDSLKNQLFIHQNKQKSDKVTKKFYYLQKNQKTHHTPKNLNITLHSSHNNNRWDSSSSRNEAKNIHQLQKRLQFLKLNRMELQERNKGKSEYSQTSKSKGTKGMFDFKGKFYGDKNNKIMY